MVDDPQRYHATSVTLNDTGWYTCIVSNDNKNQYTVSHWLIVKPGTNPCTVSKSIFHNTHNAAAPA